MSSGAAFLEEVYSTLGLTDGTLLKPASEPTDDTAPLWQRVGDWLTLADRMHADRVFFVGDNPVLVFSAMPDDAEERDIIHSYRQAWSLARPQCIFIATVDQLRVYDLATPPPATLDEWHALQPLRTLRDAAQVAEVLHDFRRSSVESGEIFSTQIGAQIENRPDQRLVADIDIVARRLREAELPPTIAHSLIERVILARYLEDREIITRDYLMDLASAHPTFVAATTNGNDFKYPIGGADGYFIRCLQNKTLTYEIFAKLATEFNGDLFVVDPEEERQVTIEHLDLIFRLLTGDTDESRPRLFLWAYDFSVIPISLISSMYEHFYHATQDADVKGTHYTPPELAEFVLGRTLTKEILDRSPRICDPACGSGTFLVEAYRMLVRHEIARTRQRPTTDLLKRLLLEKIAGVDLNDDAIHLTAFSLYLAYLNYQTPQDIRRAGPLPSLINKQWRTQEPLPLITSDFFCPTASEEASGLFDSRNARMQSLPWNSHSFDVVVGNPPWTSPKVGSKSAGERWVKEQGLPVGDRNPSQLFLWRALEMLSPGGVASMLVAASVFHSDRSQLFRFEWLGKVDVDEVINFTQTRRIFFAESIAPFFLVRFRIHREDEDVMPVTYWTVRPSSSLTATRAMAYGRVDRRLISQASLRQRDYLWKVYAWGNHKDESLMSRLDQEPTLRDLFPGRKRIGGWGYQRGRKPPTPTLRNLQSLVDFEPWGPVRNSWLEQKPDGIKRWPSDSLYYGRRLLITRGAKAGFGPYVRLEEKPFSFRHHIYSIPMSDLPEWQVKVVYAIFLSSLGRYRLFMTSRSWAIWYDNILAEDIALLPVRLFDEADSITQEVCDLVDEIMEWSPGASEFWEQKQPDEDDKPVELLSRLDNAIYRMFDLTKGEIDLIEDWRRFTLEFDSRGSRPLPGRNKWISSYELGADAGLQFLPDPMSRYIRVFVDKWNIELDGAGEMAWDVLFGGGSSPVAVVLRALEKPAPLISGTDLSDGLADWLNTLTRLGDALPTDLGRVISTNGVLRAIGGDYFVIVKRNEQRLWSASAAYEDFDATLLNVMRSSS